MKAARVHMRTPGDEGMPVCHDTRTKQPKLSWALSDVSCEACRRRVLGHPQLFNAIMAARQTVLPGTE